MVPLRLDPPPEIEVRVGPDGQPRAFRWRRRWRAVDHAEAEWAHVHGWWQDDVQHRAVYRVVTRDGLRCVVFRDNQTDKWHMLHIMD